MRLIDADALLYDIHNAMCADCKDECAACQWRDAIKLIENAPTVATDNNVPSKWISVKDGKPPSIREPHYRDAFRPVYLYTKKDNSVYVGWYLGEDYRGIDCYICRTSMKSYQHITKKITHWMPLPEPPEEDNNG